MIRSSGVPGRRSSSFKSVKSITPSFVFFREAGEVKVLANELCFLLATGGFCFGLVVFLVEPFTCGFGSCTVVEVDVGSYILDPTFCFCGVIIDVVPSFGDLATEAVDGKVVKEVEPIK